MKIRQPTNIKNNLKKIVQVEESKRLEFWMSHLLVILATIIGVYLAASLGFEKAIEYELVKSDKDSFYLRSAMQQELKDNLDNINLWSADFLAGNAKNYIGKPEGHQLEDFVWKAMQESPATFEIPSDILTGIRRFYANTRINLNKMARKNYSAHDDVKTMQAESQKIETELLPLLDSNIQALRVKLKKFDIDV